MSQLATSEKRARPWLSAFLLALLISTLVFLPFVIMDKGLFFYYGDFNVQQIPFYQLVHRSVRSGDIFWNWHTDLGANFIGSYSFYNLFSPFFWLTLPFPNAAVPYLIAPLLVLKTGCAALTSCLYLSRFVTDKRYAIFGSLLYAFSGFATYNIFFNHFHEVIVFFPLVLLSLEMLVVDKRRGAFALAVAVNCMVNYWFFIGTVMFTILYFIVRSLSGGWIMTFKTFIQIAFEATVGVMAAAMALLPSVLAIMGNPRTTADNVLSGWNFWFYWEDHRIPAILTSLVFPPDNPSRLNMYPNSGAQWASLSAWLPMIGPTFLVGYFLAARRTWLRRMLGLCLLMALVPGFNALFILFNHSYYARWFYMPLLLMTLCSVAMLERVRKGYGEEQAARGFKYTMAAVLLITGIIGLTPEMKDDESFKIGLMTDAWRFWAYVAIVALGLLCTGLLLWKFLHHRRFFAIATVMLGCICVAYSVLMIAYGRTMTDASWTKEIAMDGAQKLKLPKQDGRFDRSDIYDGMDNLGMYWGLPNIQAFHSIVPVSIMEFYPSVGVKRDVSSKPQWEYYQLRSLLSVRWLFASEEGPKGDIVVQEETEERQSPVKYFTKVDNQLGFDIYENDNYLPMGQAHTKYLTHERFEEMGDNGQKQMLLHKAVVLGEEDISKLGHILEPLSEDDMYELSEDAYLEDVKTVRKNSPGKFWRDNRGFTSEIQLAADSVVFYSVPYDKGWSATVNGKPAEVLKVNNGFVGIVGEKGNNLVRFDYLAPGVTQGAMLSAAGAVLLLLYLLLGDRKSKKPQVQRDELMEQGTENGGECTDIWALSAPGLAGLFGQTPPDGARQGGLVWQADQGQAPSETPMSGLPEDKAPMSETPMSGLPEDKAPKGGMPGNQNGGTGDTPFAEDNAPPAKNNEPPFADEERN